MFGFLVLSTPMAPGAVELAQTRVQMSALFFTASHVLISQDFSFLLNERFHVLCGLKEVIITVIANISLKSTQVCILF